MSIHKSSLTDLPVKYHVEYQQERLLDIINYSWKHFHTEKKRREYLNEIGDGTYRTDDIRVNIVGLIQSLLEKEDVKIMNGSKHDDPLYLLQLTDKGIIRLSAWQASPDYISPPLSISFPALEE